MTAFREIPHATRESVADDARMMKIRTGPDGKETFYVVDDPAVPPYLAPHWIPVFWDILWKQGRWPQLVFVCTECIDDCYYAQLGYWMPI